MWLRQIGYRRQVSLCIDASLSGIKIPMPQGYTEPSKQLTPEEDKTIDAAMQSAMKRHREERNV